LHERAPGSTPISATTLDAILSATADGILVVGGDGKVLLANRRFAELWRIPDELLSEGDDERLLAFVLDQLRDPEAFLAKVHELYGTAREDFDQLEFKDGRVFERFSAPLVENGGVAGRVWSFRDVTARAQAEAALRESEARWRRLYNEAPVMMHSADAERRLIEVSDYWLRSLGYERSQVIGRPVAEFCDDETNQRVDAAWEAYLRDGRVRDFPLRFRRADGTWRDVLASSVAELDEAGQLVRTHSVFIDVTERLRAEEEKRSLEAQVLHAQKLESLGVLAGGIAHDFNNILLSVIGNAELAADPRLPRSEVVRHLDDVVKASERAAELCRQMLAYAGRKSFRVERVDLADLADEMRDLLAVSLSKRARVVRSLPEGVAVVDGDPTQLRQVILNLMTNASDALEGRDGTIALRVGVERVDIETARERFSEWGLRPGEYACIEVEDTGVGMNEETRRRLFDPFFSTKAPGRGLGLAATLGIVRGHHGAIEVESEPGRGTRIRVLLPSAGVGVVVEPHGEPAPASPPPALEAHVLVVDDEPAVRELARTVLERAGGAVTLASDGQEALEAIEADPERFDVVLLDLTMPRLSGLETLEEIRTRWPGLPVLLSSGFAELPPDARGALDGVRFISKPYRSRELVEALNEMRRSR